MAFRFRRSKKIMPGLRLNVSKGGVSVRAGGKGFECATLAEVAGDEAAQRRLFQLG